MEEQWRPVPDYPNYEVSDWGNVRRSDTHRAIKQYSTKKKGNRCRIYPFVTIYNGSRESRWLVYVHLLVMETFNPEYPYCPTCGCKKEVNHKDEDGKNNRYDNLEYVTHSQNVAVSKQKQSNTTKEWYQTSALKALKTAM